MLELATVIRNFNKWETVMLEKLLCKRKFKHWWSSIPPLSTKGTITSHLNWTHWIQKRQWHMTLEIQVQAWDKNKHVAGFNWLLRSQHSSLDNWISKVNTFINRR